MSGKYKIIKRVVLHFNHAQIEDNLNLKHVLYFLIRLDKIVLLYGLTILLHTVQHGQHNTEWTFYYPTHPFK